MRVAMPDDNPRSEDGIDVRSITVGRQVLRVAIKRGAKDRPPLLLFNGIGANWELTKPFLHAMKKTEVIIFDIPGVGGSPLPSRPYRPSAIAGLAAKLVTQLGYDKVDVAGVSWGGGAAQQFAFQHRSLCRRLVLAATSPGAIMVPGRLSVIWKLATPRRYIDKDYLNNIAGEIYGGAFRNDQTLAAHHAGGMSGVRGMGYFYQLIAMAGWSSLPWLWSLKQPTLVMMGTDDPIVPPTNGKFLSWMIPNSQLVFIDDGHLFMITRPMESAGIVERFLSKDDHNNQ